MDSNLICTCTYACILRRRAGEKKMGELLSKCVCVLTFLHHSLQNVHVVLLRHSAQRR